MCHACQAVKPTTNGNIEISIIIPIIPSPLSSRIIARNYHSNPGVLCRSHSLSLLADHLKIWHGEDCEVGLFTPERIEGIEPQIRQGRFLGVGFI